MSSLQGARRDLRYRWFCDILNVVYASQSVRICGNDEYHYTYANNPEGYEDALLPKHWLLRHVDEAVEVSVLGVCERRPRAVGRKTAQSVQTSSE